ncbi:MAG: hypothetical protein JXB03_00055 [Spirochaetales bacterium]|nr:hypothetical protein [Spirochaetales bacterium]
MKKLVLAALLAGALSLLYGERFSVLYFNVWSGLSGEGVFVSRSYEQPGSHDFRYELLVEGLKTYSPTFTGLSELNPLPARVKRIAADTDSMAVEMGENGGLRIGVVGLPYNLYTGSALFGSKGTALEEAGITTLSGSYAGNMVFLGSARKILICKASVKGEELYLAIANWSEGLYADEANFRDLVTLHGKGALDGKHMLKTMDEAMKMEERRFAEAEKTVDFINRIAGTAPVILMGTLSCSAESEEYRLLLEAGFKDAWISGEGVTWDESRNTNISAQNIDRYKAGVSRDRVDYILYRGGGLKVLSSRLIFNRPTFSTYPSDHFGVMSTFDLQ